MSITKEQSEQLLEAAKPLIQWLNDNGHPHTTAIVTTTDVEVMEGIATMRTTEFIKD